MRPSTFLRIIRPNLRVSDIVEKWRRTTSTKRRTAPAFGLMLDHFILFTEIILCQEKAALSLYVPNAVRTSTLTAAIPALDAGPSVFVFHPLDISQKAFS